MSTLVDNAGADLARLLREERESRRWSLADMAERSGVSKAAISKIERGETSPTASVLARLASALGLTLAGLLLKVETGEGLLMRAADQPTWRDPASGYVRRQLFARADHPLEMVRVTMPPGQSVTMPEISHRRIREVVHVIEGALTFVEGGRRTLLDEGDSLGYGHPSDVTYANESDRPCTYIVFLSRG